MAIGILVTKGEIDTITGNLARTFQRSFRDVETMKTFLNITTDQELIALGYTAGEVTIIKGSINDLFQLKSIWEGTSNLTVAKNFTSPLRQLWGLGAF